MSLKFSSILIWLKYSAVEIAGNKSIQCMHTQNCKKNNGPSRDKMTKSWSVETWSIIISGELRREANG